MDEFGFRLSTLLLNSLRIIAGGQTGADRAALDWAMAHGLPHGGWCPHGRRAEDGFISARYQLKETPSVDPAQRTEWNVRDSDGTVIFSIGPELRGGSRLTAECARRQAKPWLHLVRSDSSRDLVKELRYFLFEHHVRILNVAGPRASEAPEIGSFVRATLQRLWTETDGLASR